MSTVDSGLIKIDVIWDCEIELPIMISPDLPIALVKLQEDVALSFYIDASNKFEPRVSDCPIISYKISKVLDPIQNRIITHNPYISIHSSTGIITISDSLKPTDRL